MQQRRLLIGTFNAARYLIRAAAPMIIALTVWTAPGAVIADQMNRSFGLVSSSEIPQARQEEDFVVLDVPHIRQPPNLCVPTSAAMILAYYGVRADPRELKALSEAHKPKSKRNTDFTYWADLQKGLAKIGHRWGIRDYPNNASGFSKGLSDIRSALDQGRPVMIDVHLGVGHTFVVMGYNAKDEVVYIRDPDVSPSKARIISFHALAKYWNNHKFGNSRSLFISRR